MAGERVTIDQLKGMSDEDILKLDTSTLTATPAAKEGDDAKGKEGDAAGGGDTAAAGAAAAAAGEGEHGLTPEQLEALAAGEVATDKDGKPKFVPHARFNEVNEEKKTAQQEAQALREQLAAVNARLEIVEKGGKLPAVGETQPSKEQQDAAAAEKTYLEERKALLKSQQEAMLEGDVEKATEIATQLEAQAEARAQRKLEEAIKRTREETRAEVEQTLTVRQLQTRAEDAAKTVYDAYPFLDNKSDKADEDAINLVVMKRDAKIAAGVEPVQAMLDAAKEVGEKFKALHTPTAPAATTDDKKKGDAAAAATAEAVKKGIAVAGAQPPTGGSVGAGERAKTGDEGEITIEQFKKMTDEEIAKLPDHVIRKLDGSLRKPA